MGLLVLIGWGKKKKKKTAVLNVALHMKILIVSPGVKETV